MIKKIHTCNKINFSSNINEVIRAVLNSLIFFFTKKFRMYQKAQKAQKRNQVNKRTKIKNALKKHLSGKK